MLSGARGRVKPRRTPSAALAPNPSKVLFTVRFRPSATPPVGRRATPRCPGPPGPAGFRGGNPAGTRADRRARTPEAPDMGSPDRDHSARCPGRGSTARTGSPGAGGGCSPDTCAKSVGTSHTNPRMRPPRGGPSPGRVTAFALVDQPAPTDRGEPAPRPGRRARPQAPVSGRARCPRSWRKCRCGGSPRAGAPQAALVALRSSRGRSC